jgi:hypothetical protein
MNDPELQELRDDKIRLDAQLESDEAKVLKEEPQDCA